MVQLIFYEGDAKVKCAYTKIPKYIPTRQPYW